MGQLSIDSLRLSLQALLDKDTELASEVRAKDKEIDTLENELINESDTDFVYSTKFKLLIFSFLIFSALEGNFKIIFKSDESKKNNLNNRWCRFCWHKFGEIFYQTH